MTENSLTNELETRRRKLDELFHDQPYLSATMRAARLHERMADRAQPIQIPIIPQAEDDDVIFRLTEARRVRLSEAANPVGEGESGANPLTPAVAAPEPAASLCPAPRPAVERPARAETSGAVLAAGQVRIDLEVDFSIHPPQIRAIARPSEDDPEVMTVHEAAKFLRLGESTLRAWVHQGRVPAARVGRHLRFRRTALREWLTAQEKRAGRGGRVRG